MSRIVRQLTLYHITSAKKYCTYFIRYHKHFHFFSYSGFNHIFINTAMQKDVGLKTKIFAMDLFIQLHITEQHLIT